MQTQAQLQAFGTAPASVTLEVTPRSAGWRIARVLGCGLPGLLFLALAILPPHALWVLAGLLLVTMAIRKWLERFTLQSLSGSCPHCGADLSHQKPTRLRERATLTCDSCQRSSELVVDMSALEGGAPG